MRSEPLKRQLLAWTVVCCAAASAGADYAVEVEIANTTGQRQADWPVILSVYQVFGRNLPAAPEVSGRKPAPGRAALNPKGYHVYDQAGREIEHSIEPIPPYDVESNNELVFRVAAIEAGAKRTYRITNTSKDSAKRAAIDCVASPHNLIANGGFERASGGAPAGWKGPGRLDTKVKRSGKSALLLAGARRVVVSHEARLALKKGCRYYAGAWCKTDNVSRNGLATGSRGAWFDLTGEGKAPPLKFSRGFGGVAIAPQCDTRDWNKSRFDSYYGKDLTGWGLYEDTVVADADSAALRLVLDQKKQYVLTGDGTGRWWVDDLVLMAQPAVRVRFDKALAPHLAGGVFVFTRPVSALHGFNPAAQLDKPRGGKLLYAAYVSYPFAHEAAKALDGFAVRGQRAPQLIGIYHTRPLEGVRVEVAGGALAGPGGAKLAPEPIELSHGYLGEVPTHFLLDHDGPIDFDKAPGIRYFLVSFAVPADARPGRYTGAVRIAAGGAEIRRIPLTLRVQDLPLPELKETYCGYIFQGGRLLNDEGLTQYARCGFSSLTTFCGFLPFKKRAAGGFELDLDALDKKMKWIRSYGLTGICIHSDVELDPQWGPGRLFRKSGGTRESYQREIKRMYDAAKQRGWPRIICMIWDEPAGHGTTLDVDFPNIPKSLNYVNLACVDNPANVHGPALYRYIRQRGKMIGFCGSAKPGEGTRYQQGILMAASGGVLQQPWHLEGKRIMGKYGGKIRRSIGLVSAGRGVDDLKICRLLQAQIAAAGKDPAKAAAVRSAEAYLKKILQTWNGDVAPTSLGTPHLGWACTWGYEQFYDDWQESMARHAAAIKGVRWIE